MLPKSTRSHFFSSYFRFPIFLLVLFLNALYDDANKANWESGNQDFSKCGHLHFHFDFDLHD